MSVVETGANAPMMTLRQAAQRSGLSPTTLRRYIKGGRLKARLIPGRYGPEYVLSEEELVHAGLRPTESSTPEATGSADSPAAPSHAVEQASSPAPPAVVEDPVPGMLYRELLMKHEQLLVQYGMLKVSGRQVYEEKQKAEQEREEQSQLVAEHEQARKRHAVEIGQLRAKLRKAELAVASRDEELMQLRQRIRQLEISLRNATTARTLDEELAKSSRMPQTPMNGPSGPEH